MDDKKLFMRRFKSLLDDHNMSPEELGRVLGVTRATISRYKNCKISMPISKISKMSKYFNVSPLWLSGLDSNKYLKNDEKQVNYIPLIGQVAAGSPILADQNIEDYITTRYKADFALKVYGDSMINARIHDGDILYVKKQSDVENGEIAVIMVDDEATVKRVYKANGTVILQPENPKYKAQIYKKSYVKNIRIIGKVIGLEIMFE